MPVLDGNDIMIDMKTKTLFTLIISIFIVQGLQAQAQSEFQISRISPIPTEIAGVDELKMNLDGTWKFNPVFEQGFENLKEAGTWSDIDVPGEWSMQGFHVDSAQAAGYFHTFRVPADWKGNRIKIRFNAVYSESVVYVNGVEAGSHLGGFTAFELDITDLVKFKKENTLVLSVTNESLTDSLASGSRYACHPLGGIPRSVSIFALPQVNISSLAIQTEFDNNFENATLKASIGLANDGANDIEGFEILFELYPWKSMEKIELDNNKIKIPVIEAGKEINITYLPPVTKPKKWDCENPNLYKLRCKLYKDGKLIESIDQRFGFREVEVKGNQLFVNGMPVKLRGVNRHEVYPITGRSVPAEMYKKDIELFREGNVNHIRTCHYPPDEALMEAADELGMFIECEGPFCWSHETKADSVRIREAITSQNLEMIVLYRNHPSIIFWSIANESIWDNNYDFAGKAMAALDPSRPITFNYFPWGWVKNQQKDEEVCAIGSDHYPSPKGPGKYADYHRPISFGEFVHLNAYNRYELATDVALRDKWGIYLHDMWEDMYKAQGVAGGSIWAGIDDTFYWDFVNDDGSIEERTVGYGTWGPIDGWRRKKPEWWGMKKTYSPIRINEVETENGQIILNLENRQDFSNLSRLKIKWKFGEEYGLTSVSIGPKKSGQLIIEPKSSMSSGKLEVIFEDPRGFIVDSFLLNVGIEIKHYDIPFLEKNTIKVQEDELFLSIISNEKEYKINKSTGLINCDVFKGPYLMILPMNNGGDTQMHGPTKYYEPYNPTCTEWKLEKIETAIIDGIRVVSVYGMYKEAGGSFLYKFNADGSITIDYDFECKEEINPRQMGLVFKLPKSYEILYWKRKGFWSTYPDWHIARLEGTAKASEGFEATPLGPRTRPEHEWRHDRTSIGSNDFASTKHNIFRVSLSDQSGKGMMVKSSGKLHSRSWIEGNKIRWLLANYSNGGSERFLRPHAAKDDIYLKPGDEVKGRVRLIMNYEL